MRFSEVIQVKFLREEMNSKFLIYGLISILSITAIGCTTTSANRKVAYPEKEEKQVLKEVNAYLHYRKAADLMKTPESRLWFDIWRVMRAGWEKENKELQGFLKSNSPTFREFERGTRKAKCHMPRVENESNAREVLYYLERFKDLTQLLRLQILYYRWKGNHNAALENAFHLLRFANHLARENLVSLGISITVQGNGYMSIREVVSEEGGIKYPSIVNRLESLEKESNRRENLGEILKEQSSAIRFGLIPLVFSRDKWEEFKKSYQASGYTQEDLVKTIEYYYGEAGEYCGKSYPQGLQMWKIPEQMKNPIQKELMPWLRNLYVECGRIEAEQRATLIIVALQYYKSKKGKYPERLNELEPDFLPSLPKDPFSEKKFIYRSAGLRWILYSVGDDLEDDKGQKHIYVSDDGRGDIIFSSR